MALYNAFYGLRESPFTLNPDPRFVFLSRQHREALAGLMYAICDAKGFALLTGEVGTGKTTLVHTLLTQLGDRVSSAVAFNPGMSRRGLYQHLLAEFRLPAEASILDATRALQRFLLTQLSAGRRAVVVIDEAHALSCELLEEIRLLTNFETSRAKLLQVLLVGQPELVAQLQRTEMRQLRQRVALRFQLTAFDFPETIRYVRSRLASAGRTEDLFAPRAYVALYQFSGGLPRVINVLCDNALLTGFARDQPAIDRRIVHRAAQDLCLSPQRQLGLWQRARTRHYMRANGHPFEALREISLPPLEFNR